MRYVDDWPSDWQSPGRFAPAPALPGLKTKDLKAAGGWSTEQMASRYSRGGIRAAQNVAKLRQAARRSD
ncbi:hypothetical protein [Parvibaculum sp.]|uniref:hypothetical protein n=1 Tax=Parvibaculum sp. TaxID=2024848 RepID=UPI00320EB71E